MTSNGVGSTTTPSGTPLSASNWAAAMQYRADQLMCPHCGATNIPKAAPTIAFDQRGIRAECATCAHSWVPELGVYP
jgi:predicted RNA-binding Zn-ribbon protein involved in translation (DUF1610 family)